VVARPTHRLPAPFAQDVDRFAWDKAVNFDLSAAVAFELDVACPLPDAGARAGPLLQERRRLVRRQQAPRRPGAPHPRLRQSDFTPEGKPAGWNRIDGIRLSPWKGAARDTALVFRRLATVEGAALVVVRGTTSCPDAGARAVAAKTAARVSRLLIEAGLGHTSSPTTTWPRAR
jgi:hypothetical protein